MSPRGYLISPVGVGTRPATSSLSRSALRCNQPCRAQPPWHVEYSHRVPRCRRHDGLYVSACTGQAGARKVAPRPEGLVPFWAGKIPPWDAMCALVVHDYEQGAPVWESGAPGPSCGDAPPPGVAVVRVVAAGLNFFDVLMCRGKYQYRPAVPFVPGVEFAGVVEHVGAGSPIPVGARVFGSLPKAGAYARRIAVPLQYLLPIPETLTFGTRARTTQLNGHTDRRRRGGRVRHGLRDVALRSH